MHPDTPQKSGEAKAEDRGSDVSGSDAEEDADEQHGSEEDLRPRKRRHLEDLKEVLMSGDKLSACLCMLEMPTAHVRACMCCDHKVVHFLSHCRSQVLIA